MKRMLTSCFGLGFLPIAPGTWGSIPVVVIYVLARLAGASTLTNSIVMMTLAVLGSVVCIKFSQVAMAATGEKDPGEIVADEVAGQAVTFLFAVSAQGCCVLVVGAAGFLLFRICDIFKPWPARSLEKLSMGWGILADDLMAGVYAGLILMLLIKTGLLETIF